ncbi:expressed unknown protein [Seminavis robusta]|uniref:Uncharacterized protein n=1 Tax=Seminavis robusta TaxID=568900 RepID=A0A9N8H6I3_9STRA|nr:expressed unknown protein [Seminavis robusta]|eukprot:Sro101_g051500.1 n/a (259) ;mRNA; r:27768-28637
MIHTKDFSVRELSPLSSSSRAGTKRSAANDADGGVLGDLFRARTDAFPTSSVMHHNDDLPIQRVAPLVSTMIGEESSLFPNCHVMKSSSAAQEQPCSSLFRQLVHTKRFKPSSSLQQSSDKTENDFVFPSQHSTLFALSALPSHNTRPASGDELLDQSLRSLTTALLITRPAAVSTQQQPSCRKRPRHQATRMRLVGQVLGQQGVRRIVSLVKEIKQQQQQNNKLVEAWENTPLDDLKKQPWEDLMRSAEEQLQASNA